jgi:two-component system chemotaxis response regulator CheB
LPARHPLSGERLPLGTILVAPPDHHVVLDRDRVLLTRGPRENGHRPAVDVLFRSAARSVGPRAIGVVLSGVLDDGTAGLVAVATRGGTAIVQDPGDALYPAMPISAARHVNGAYVLPVAGIAALLTRLVGEEVPDPGPPPDLMEYETEIAKMDEEAINNSERPGVPSGFSCPDCHGALWEIKDGDLVRYRCRVGHAWSSESLLGEQSEQLDDALWMALRGLEEKAALARDLGERAQERGSVLSAQRFREQAVEAARAATLIRSMLEAHVGASETSELGA